MRQYFFILIIHLLLLACQNQSRNAENIVVDTMTEGGFDEITENQQETTKRRVTFKNISDIVVDSSYNIWVEKNSDTLSLALQFEQKDTLRFCYSPECYLYFPYKLKKDKIFVYWDKNIDTKYDFDIVNAVNQINNKYIGKPFMTLELINDTTLKAFYLEKDIIGKINSSNNVRTFFPDKFSILQVKEETED